MSYRQKYLSACLLGIAALLVGAAPAFAAKPSAPSLGTASSFAVLSAAPDGGGAVTCTRGTITGDVGSSGLLASVVLTEGCTIVGATIAPVSAQVLRDFNRAYDQYAAIACTGTLETAYTNTTLTLTPGVYCNTAAVTFTNTTLILDGQGDANAVWIFKIGTSGTGYLEGTNFTVNLINGATACNVYWWVAQYATITTSQFIGTILAGAAITVTSGGVGTFEGRALAKAAVTLTDAAFVGCESGSRGGKPQGACNQGVGNGPEQCDPGNSTLNPFRPSNDETGGTRGNPGRKGSFTPL